MLDLILSAVQVVAAVRAEMETRAAAERHAELRREISRVSRSLAALRQCTHDPRSADMRRAMVLYRSLVRSVRNNRQFASQIDLVPVMPGVVRLVLRAEPAKSTVLRDPKGEFSERLGSAV